MKKKELTVEHKAGEIRISIGMDTLIHALKMNDRFDEFTVAEKELFANNFIDALNREEEDGTTPVHQLLDDTFDWMSEQGDDSIEFNEQ